MKKFRFGIQSRVNTGPEWIKMAKEIEAMGYSTLMLPDHFGDQLAPVPALTAAAAATEKLRVGALVWCNDYKHPLVLAKEIATMDVLSGGRIEVGIGAGWMKVDYDVSGMPYDPPGVRIDRMIEGLAVMRGHWGDAKFSYESKHYTIHDLEGYPRPVQKPPPVLIGGGGPRILKTAARLADIIGINVDLRSGVISKESASNATDRATDEKVGWIREAAGERWSQLELNMMVWVTTVTPHRDAVLEKVAQNFGASVDAIRDAPNLLIGTVDEICTILQERRDRYGISYVVVQSDSARDFAPVVERLTGT